MPVGQLGNFLLRHHLGLAVRRDRVEVARLIDELALGHPVVAAGGGKQEPSYAGFLGNAREADTCSMVDCECEVWVEIAKWIIRQRGQVDDRLDTRHIL